MIMVFAREINIEVRGLISKFSPGCGRTGTDRQFLYVNGRPCALGKVCLLSIALSSMTWAFSI